MIKRVYEVDPLVCARCGGEMRIIAFIVDPAVIDKILRHLVAKGDHRVRGPPGWALCYPEGRSALHARKGGRG